MILGAETHENMRFLRFSWIFARSCFAAYNHQYLKLELSIFQISKSMIFYTFQQFQKHIITQYLIGFTHVQSTLKLTDP